MSRVRCVEVKEEIPLRLVQILTLVFAVFVGCVIYLANQGAGNGLLGLVQHLPGGDKLGHFFLFGVFSFLLNLALGFRSVRVIKIDIYTGSLAVLVFTAIEELSQGGITTRTLDLFDYLADLAGVLTFALLTKRVERLCTHNEVT